jgi:Tol biopolymer transport system component
VYCFFQLDKTTLVSVSTNGVGCGDGDCFDPIISREGRCVAFVSMARNLAPGLTSGVNTYWRDTAAKTNVALAGPSYYVCPPSMSADGRYLAYFGVSGSLAQLRVRDMQTGKDVYTNTGTVTAAALSPTGQRLLYRISGTVSVADVMARTNIVSFSSPVTSWTPSAWSADGGALAGVAGTNGASTNLFVWDFGANSVSLVCSNYQPVSAASASSDSPVLSADGRFVVFRSYATNLVAGASNAPNLYLFDRVARTTSLLTAGQAGSGPVVYNSKPVLSADGSMVSFVGLGTGLLAGDLNRQLGVFGVAGSTGSAIDSDGDGIPDWWMDLYFGHSRAQAGDNSRAQDDADGDGQTNWQEWLAGTSPRDPTSALRLVAVTASTSGVALTWQSASGANYFVQRDADLSSEPGFVSIQSNIVGRAGVTSFTDTNATPRGKGFYRVGVQQ